VRYLKTKKTRKGAVLVENAIVLLVLITFIVGILVGGLGVFRYQQVVTLAREGARYASVRGTESGLTLSATDVYDNAILPMAVGLDPSSLTYTVTWPNGKAATYADSNSNPPGLPKGATVEVTVSYTWIPEAFLGGATFTSKSVMPMQY
jgi:Flp pilus assembly protein TadG